MGYCCRLRRYSPTTASACSAVIGFASVIHCRAESRTGRLDVTSRSTRISTAIRVTMTSRSQSEAVVPGVPTAGRPYSSRPPVAVHVRGREAHLVAAGVRSAQDDNAFVLRLLGVCQAVHGDVVALAQGPQQPGRVGNAEPVPCRGAVVNLALPRREINEDPQVTTGPWRKRSRFVTREGPRRSERRDRHRRTS